MSYPQTVRFIHNKWGVIHSRDSESGCVAGCILPDMGGTEMRRGKDTHVDSNDGAVENREDRGLLAVIVEPLAQGDDRTAEVCVFLDQVGDALATVEDGGVITSS
jgi:hypothetical protein